jgi:hypothetical protein
LVQYYYRKKAEKHAMFGEAFSYLALSIAEPKATQFSEFEFYGSIARYKLDR